MDQTSRRTPLVIACAAAVVLGLAVAGVGAFPWPLLAQLNARLAPQLPWCIPATLLWLGILWKYLNGAGWPRSTSRDRQALLRANRLPRPARIWVAGSIVVGCITLVAAYLVAIQFVDLPAHAFRPRTAGSLSWGVSIMVMATSALVAGVVEEAAYRGYMQGLLGRRLSSPIAITITTLAFTGVHLLGGAKMLPLAIPVAAASVLFGALTSTSGSILPAIALHTLTDATTLPLEWELVGHLPVGRFYQSGLDPVLLGIGVLALAGAVTTAALLLKVRQAVRT